MRTHPDRARQPRRDACGALITTLCKAGGDGSAAEPGPPQQAGRQSSCPGPGPAGLRRPCAGPAIGTSAGLRKASLPSAVNGEAPGPGLLNSSSSRLPPPPPLPAARLPAASAPLPGTVCAPCPCPQSSA
ncbi:protein diaphanous homolog 1-like [Pithys albifrons albifrons]|uniref:protein diaphanous homolog 1-like n=1 Tax=Pithys albifrons albifrons TaxID=3385563 RepID=UPI003A5D0213